MSLKSIPLILIGVLLNWFIYSSKWSDLIYYFVYLQSYSLVNEASSTHHVDFVDVRRPSEDNFKVHYSWCTSDPAGSLECAIDRLRSDTHCPSLQFVPFTSRSLTDLPAKTVQNLWRINSSVAACFYDERTVARVRARMSFAYPREKLAPVSRSIPLRLSSAGRLRRSQPRFSRPI